ncbi:uncharacterized protein LOC123524132 [Mercenaria mercenaria]|uniref:uncharacterized protein LOC123524132 n=1 Tax=Mercenaria mercenaria TaxID=6596 RepID=UPI00234F2586|nr:uncharacterized protein LOC123524132 [Mercenaria mercenaria]
MAKESSGCFAWLFSLKTSCNERWARFRNRFRQRFYARRGQTVDPATVLNETGTRDIVITKTPYKTNKVLPLNLATAAVVKEDQSVPEQYPHAAETDKGFDHLVDEYVLCIIRNAADSLRQASHSSTHIVMDNVADDKVSLSSSIISQIADTAVTESLTNIVLEADINYSAIHVTKARTVKEFMEALGIVSRDVDDGGLPPVCL